MREGTIGEVVSASVLGGLEIKMEMESEDLKIGYPAVVEGTKYDFYCMIFDVMNPANEIAETVATSKFRDVMPLNMHESYSGRILYPKAKLRPIQLIERESGALSEPETVPPYFSLARMATTSDARTIYKDEGSPIGTIRGLPDFHIGLNLEKLTEKPFAIFGRTGAGKSIFNKLLCNGIIGSDASTVLIFDMQDEYGIYSRSDNTPGLKYFHPAKVELFSLDPKNKEAKPFVIDTSEVRPQDIIVAYQGELSEHMIDAIFEMDRRKRNTRKDLVTFIMDADPEEYQDRILPATLGAVKRRLARLERLDFVKLGAKDSFQEVLANIKTGKSVVLEFGSHCNDQFAYLFVANVMARRLYEVYQERSEDYPRLVIFLEEAHRFLERGVVAHTIFDRMARETRKFNLILALVDQRPAKIDEDVRSQLANRLVLSLKEPSDVSSAMAGVPDRSVWEKVVSTMPPRTVAVIGDAIRVPTVVEVMEYTPENVKKFIVKEGKTEKELDEMTKKETKEAFRF
jgi:DNA helicase HerA-like ATPase